MRADRIGVGSNSCSFARSVLTCVSTVRSPLSQRIAPHAVHQLRAREHRAGALQQRGEQAVFVAREVEPAPAAADAMAFGVVLEPVAGAGSACGAHAPQHRAHARHQLARREGFGDVIVGAEFEAEHALGFGVAAR